jgi:MFS family permease
MTGVDLKPPPVHPRLTSAPILWGLTGYQWLVVAAAWLGWGFDVFDGLLFNYVSKLCLPDLLHLAPEDPLKGERVAYWTGLLTSILLVGWGFGGILFGKVCDRVGRSRTLLITMLVYSLATAGCALSTNIWMLVVFRVIASLGIGGEWAAGAALVAETVPEKKRVQAGMLLYTSSPFGIFLATFVTDYFENKAGLAPGEAWRGVFLTGLVPAAVAFLIRMKVREPDTWRRDDTGGRMAELFSPPMLRRTLGGLSMSIIALLGWWSCFAFIPLISSKLQMGRFGPNAYSLGGLIGTLFTYPIAVSLGRRAMFGIYFAVSAAAVWAAFGAPVSAEARMYLIFLVGVGVFGVFGAFTFYLPELFPTRLRSTGAGFCYNTGRFIAAAGPFVVGAAKNKEVSDLLHAVSWVAVFPAFGVLLVLLGVGEETKGRALAEHG